MVKGSEELVPPLLQPRSPELPLGVFTATLAVPGAETMAVVIVAANCWLLMTVVVSAVPLRTITEAETKWLPLTVRTKPCCTCANVIVLAERDPMLGEGRALPHKGFSELQPCRSSIASGIAMRARTETETRVTDHRSMMRACFCHDAGWEKW